jgi:hypothetical protein
MDAKTAGEVAEHLARATSRKSQCSIKIRALAGPGRLLLIANRLSRSLKAAGFKTFVVETTSLPSSDILIESSLEQADAALALQSSFLMAGVQVQLLVHQKPEANLVVIHLGSDV